MLTEHLEGEQQFRLLADNAPVMIWRSDRSKGCDFFNRPWLEFTGKALEAELGFGWAEGVHPDDFERCVAIYTAAFDAREPFSMDYRLRRHDGAFRWVLDNGRPYFVGGAFAGYFGSCIDVTEMKEALAEKEMLLREVHHRVRNNMQLVSSLLELQADRMQDEPARAILQQTAGRVRSIAMAQEQLHAADSFTRLDFGAYARTLVDAVSGLNLDRRVEIDVDADPVVTRIDRAVPLGLLLNELLTNALKHAFPDGRSGRVRVTVRRRDGGTVDLTVADDGVGMPNGVIPDQARTLGLQIVQTLARQARAEIDFDHDAGTRVTVRLSPEDS